MQRNLSIFMVVIENKDLQFGHVLALGTES